MILRTWRRFSSCCHRNSDLPLNSGIFLGFETRLSLLRKYQVAYTNVDEPLLPSDVYVTTDFAYFRWHGRGKKPWFNYRYKIEELEPWIPKIRKTSEKVKQVYGYFNNHFHGYAPENCLNLLERLTELTPQQAETKKRMSKKQVGLSGFIAKN